MVEMHRHQAFRIEGNLCLWLGNGLPFSFVPARDEADDLPIPSILVETLSQLCQLLLVLSGVRGSSRCVGVV